MLVPHFDVVPHLGDIRYNVRNFYLVVPSLVGVSMDEVFTHGTDDAVILWNKVSEPLVIRVDVSEDDTINSIWYM